MHTMSGFTKLFNSILYSTIWSEPDHVRIVWITMLAMSNQYGEVQAALPGLARMAGKSMDETEDALTRFLNPDPHSRTPDNEGRRIEVIDGGWRLLNHGKYRSLMSAEERKEYNRKKQAERRARQKGAPVNDMFPQVNDNQQSTHITEAEAEAEAEAIEPKTGMVGRHVLPADWKRAKPAERMRRRVLCNNGLMKRIGKWFNRKPDTLWYLGEGIALSEINPPMEEVDLLEEWYLATDVGDRDFRRRDLSTLLNNWPVDLDRARLWKAENP